MKSKLGLWIPAAMLLTTAGVQAQGTTFTYQGRLQDGTTHATGFYDLTFSVWTTPAGPAQVGGSVTNLATGVTNGLFAVALDFGGGVFDGNPRWLEIGVRTNGGGVFTKLSPRQVLTATPYAIFAGGVNAAGISGTIPVATIGTLNVSTQVVGQIAGNGGGLTNLQTTNIVGHGIQVRRIGNRLFIRTHADATADWLETIQLHAPNPPYQNDVVNFESLATLPTTAPPSAMTGVEVKTSGDDACPINVNGTYIGGNHGAFFVQEVSSAGHGKDSSDIGSLWSDGLATWEVVRIVDSVKLWVMGTNAGAFWASFPTTIGSTLIHITGATHTGEITVGSAARTQLWPATKQIERTVTVNGAELPNDVVITTGKVLVRDTYEIVDPVAVLAMLRTNATAPFTNAASLCRISMQYEWQESGACLVAQQVLPFQTFAIGYFGGVQSAMLATPLGGTNLLATPSGPQFVPPAKTITLDNSLRAWVQATTNSSGLSSAFAIGYVSQPEASNMRNGVLFTSGKTYPAYRSGGHLSNGYPASVLAFRAPMVCTSSNAVARFETGGLTNLITLQLGTSSTLSAGALDERAIPVAGSWALPVAAEVGGGIVLTGAAWSVSRLVLSPPQDTLAALGTLTANGALSLPAANAPTIPGLWNSNSVLYWVTDTKTNLISDGR